MIGWTAVIFAIQGWLGETPASAAAATTPAYMQIGMAAMSLGVVSAHWSSPSLSLRFLFPSILLERTSIFERGKQETGERFAAASGKFSGFLVS